MFIEDETITLKQDIQECLSYKINLNTDYNLLSFDEDNMEYINSLGCFEDLEIEPHNSRMKFTGEIANDLDILPEEQRKISSMVLQRKLFNLYNQTNNNFKIVNFIRKIDNEELNEFVEEIEEDNDIQFKEPSKADKAKLKVIKSNMNDLGLKLEYEETEDMIMLSGNFKYLKFNKKSLRRMIGLIKDLQIDLFLIAPLYDDETNAYENDDDAFLDDFNQEECKGIRLVFGIYLEALDD